MVRTDQNESGMRVCGVVSEFNPFHNGHGYLLKQIRDYRVFDAVVCVMSGDFVQRGEYAVCDKRERARAAVENGADLVLSLPFPWSCATAEIFARGAVSVLHSLGCVNALAFGSESGDISLIEKCGECIKALTNDEIKEYQRRLPSLSFAQARQKLVADRVGEKTAELLMRPNDILATEYLKAISYLHSTMTLITVKRALSSHDGTVINDSFSSSSHIRKLASVGDFQNALSFMPQNSGYFRDTYREIDEDAYFRFLSGAILSRSPRELAELCEIGGGFEFAVHRETLATNSFRELTEALSFRHITDAKIRRALLFASLGVKKSALSSLPAFTEVLSCNERGKAVLASVRNKSEITILSKTANIQKASELAKEQFELQRKAEKVFEKLTKNKQFKI